MKYFLIGLAIWFIAAWLPWFARDWVYQAQNAKAKANAPKSEQWVYEF